MRDVYIGYDPREAVAYHVCANSFIRHSTVPLSFKPLALKNLSGYIEKKDRHVIENYPPTNQFIFSRFLIPYLQNYKGWALFVDGDMIILDDVEGLFSFADESKAVMCVKHDYKTKFPVKYLGQNNMDYDRKNWSSVVLWNCGHEANKALTLDYVINATGKQLHRFEWLRDEDIGELPAEWNWLPDEYGENKNAKLLHYTVGTPCFHEYGCTVMADKWHTERMLTNYSLQV